MLDALVLVVALASPPAELPVCYQTTPNGTKLKLEIANTNQSREYGLMNRTRLPEHTGMIFVFDGDGPVTFWMKDTLIPLDMVFVGNNGDVRAIYPNVPVVDPKLQDGQIPLESAPARFVIELPANEAVKDGIVAGHKMLVTKSCVP